MDHHFSPNFKLDDHEIHYVFETARKLSVPLSRNLLNNNGTDALRCV